MYACTSMKNLDQQMKKLFQLQDSKHKILSLYLGVSGKDTPTPKRILSSFHSLIHRNLSQTEKELFKDDLEKIERYIQGSLDTHAVRSIIFFCDNDALWEVLSFEFYLSPLCIVGYVPYIQPLIDAQEIYKKYLVIAVDRKQAIFFTVRFGEIEEKFSVTDGHVPQKVRANERDYYGRSDKILRHIEEHLHRHLKLIAEAASHFVRTHDVSFIILAGHKNLLSQCKKHLDPSLQKMVVAEFVTDLHSSLAELLLQSKKAAFAFEESVTMEKLQKSLSS